MLKRLDIENFRILRDFHTERLGQVNLIVGKNNAGKSTVLEAIRIFAANAQRSILENISIEHDERYRHEDGAGTLPFQDLFSRSGSRTENRDKVIKIGDKTDPDKHIAIQNVLLREYSETVTSGSEAPYTVVRRRKIDSLDELAPNEESRRALEVIKSGKSFYLILDTRNRTSRLLDMTEVTPCGVVPTRLVSMDELAQLWDKIVFSEDEHLVKEAIRFISPDFEALTFIESEDYESDRPRSSNIRRQGRRVPMVKMSDVEGGVPLKSLGDGISRIFQLSLKILEAKDGFLLIDEFENGIHYTAQEKIWNYVFAAAKRLNIQVFATTHSWDCIESFSKASCNHAGMGVLFRVGRSVRKSDDGKVIATEFYGEDLLRIAQSDLEVR